MDSHNVISSIRFNGLYNPVSSGSTRYADFVVTGIYESVQFTFIVGSDLSRYTNNWIVMGTKSHMSFSTELIQMAFKRVLEDPIYTVLTTLEE